MADYLNKLTSKLVGIIKNEQLGAYELAKKHPAHSFYIKAIKNSLYDMSRLKTYSNKQFYYNLSTKLTDSNFIDCMKALDYFISKNLQKIRVSEQVTVRSNPPKITFEDLPDMLKRDINKYFCIKRSNPEQVIVYLHNYSEYSQSKEELSTYHRVLSKYKIELKVVIIDKNEESKSMSSDEKKNFLAFLNNY